MFERMMKRYRDNDLSLLQAFNEEYKARAFTGIRSIDAKSYITYKTFCVTCLANLDRFFNKFNPTNIMDTYEYKFKIKGYIHCRISGYNIYLSFANMTEALKEVDFASLNSYIYNQVYGLNNQCLLFSVFTDCYYLINTKQSDYTMGRGFFSQTNNHKAKRRGTHCNRCKNSCRAIVVNGLKRLEVII